MMIRDEGREKNASSSRRKKRVKQCVQEQVTERKGGNDNYSRRSLLSALEESKKLQKMRERS